MTASDFRVEKEDKRSLFIANWHEQGTYISCHSEDPYKYNSLTLTRAESKELLMWLVDNLLEAE